MFYNRSFLLAIGIATLSSLGAQAQSLPTTKDGPAAAPSAEPWEGFYLGVSVGHSLGDVSLKLPGSADLDGLGAMGPSAGGLIGFNQVLGAHWLAGVELSGDYNGVKTTLNVNEPGGAANLQTDSDYSAAISGRVGYLATPSTLVYGSIGATAVDGEGSYTISSGGKVVSQALRKDYFYGVAFVGLGVETVISGNLHARVEYVASFLNANTYRNLANLQVTPDLGSAKFALIYDLGGSARPPANAMKANWTGAYLGGGLGRDFSLNESSLSSSGVNVDFSGSGGSGWSGRLFAGYDFELADRFVVGAEAIGGWSSLQSSYSVTSGGPTLTLVNRTPDDYGVRARFGVLAAPETLIYGLVGIERISDSSEASSAGQSVKADTQQTAWEVGGGAETFLTDHISARVEYAVSSWSNNQVFELVSTAGASTRYQSTGMAAIAYHF